MMKLSDLGFDPWFEAYVNDMRQEDQGIARVSAVDRNSYIIRNEIGEVPAELAGKYFIIFYDKLTPIVFTTVKESGVMLTVRYLVSPRERRKTEQQIWEATLDALDKADDIELAYPATRFYCSGRPTNKD